MAARGNSINGKSHNILYRPAADPPPEKEGIMTFKQFYKCNIDLMIRANKVKVTVYNQDCDDYATDIRTTEEELTPKDVLKKYGNRLVVCFDTSSIILGYRVYETTSDSYEESKVMVSDVAYANKTWNSNSRLSVNIAQEFRTVCDYTLADLIAVFGDCELLTFDRDELYVSL